LLIISLLLAVFRGNLLNIVAAANIGYLVVFILLGVGAILAYRTIAPTCLQRAIVLALGVFVFVGNMLLLLIGGWQWGAQVFWIGLALLFTFLPFYGWAGVLALRARRPERRATGAQA
jgi:hypothetical protein